MTSHELPTALEGTHGAPDPVADLRLELAAAVAALRDGLEAPGEAPRLDRARKPEFGDYSTNAALLVAPVLGSPPREVAATLGEALASRLGPALDRAEVAGPGFLNLFMSDDWCRRALARMLDAGEAWGRGVHPRAPETVLIEFVSANPTGPITAASGRHAAYGDALARILEWAGHRVDREYYVNDFGSQVRRFAESIRARARDEEPPMDGYRGEYVRALAREIPGAAEADVQELERVGVERMLASVAATLERFGVLFDGFFSERSLHESGAIERAIGVLEERGQVFRSEGAEWLRSSALGDDKDRVLRRSSGELTYFAADIGYHEDKRERGFERVIDVLGADHHGYVTRMRAAWAALGGDPDAFELPIMQLVNLSESGRRVAMSKREGEFVTLDELMDDIGVDAARFFLLQRSHETTLDLDLALAREQSQDNPVYYVQYAHARIASILRRIGPEGVRAAAGSGLAGGEAPHPSARALLLRLLDMPEEVRTAAARRAPHRFTTYGQEVAQGFSAFYRDCKVVGAAEEGGDEEFRVALCVAAQRVIARSLDLLGVSAPEEM